MAAKREEVYRSLLNELLSAASMSGKTVLVPGLATDTLGATSWFEFQLVSLIPTRTRTDNLLAKGTLRVICRSRPGPSSASHDVSFPYEMVDNVVAALERKNVKVKDYVTGSGTLVKGIAQVQEIQVDDLNDELNGVRPIICTAEYVLSSEG